MKIVLDTNLLTRNIQPDHPSHTQARNAIVTLRRRGDELCVLAQNLYEFWVVCTRPPTQYDGFGMTAAQAHAELANAKGLFALYRDPAGLYDEWEKLVVHHEVMGKNAHDARLVAAMNLHGLKHILTFNASDFARFDKITVFTPDAVVPLRS